jgi:hypothetical protein
MEGVRKLEKILWIPTLLNPFPLRRQKIAIFALTRLRSTSRPSPQSADCKQDRHQLTTAMHHPLPQSPHDPPMKEPARGCKDSLEDWARHSETFNEYVNPGDNALWDDAATAVHGLR